MQTAITTLENFVRSQPNVQTLVASLTGICWWYGYNLNSRLNTFVLQEATQLVKRPVVRLSRLQRLQRLLSRLFTLLTYSTTLFWFSSFPKILQSPATFD